LDYICGKEKEVTHFVDIEWSLFLCGQQKTGYHLAADLVYY
jgi:hypothetical protein